MQGYKDAAGRRNKSFPHFDELTIIFGKDSATGKVAETPANVVENIQVKEAVAKEPLEA